MSFRRINWAIAALVCVAGGESKAFAQRHKARLSNSISAKMPAPTSADARAASLLDAARKKLRAGSFSEVEVLLRSAQPIITDPLVRISWNVLFADLKEAQGAWAEAAFYAAKAISEMSFLNGTDKRKNNLAWNSSTRMLFFKVLKNNLQAGLTVASLNEFERFKNDLSRELLTSSEELLLKKLADELRRIDRSQDALVVEKLLFKFYPFVSKALMDSLTPDTVCRLDEEQNVALDKRSRASQLIQKLGSREDLTQYAMSISGVPNALRWLQQPVDTLSGQIRNELLDLVDWLQSVREYPTALEITNKLILSQNFEPPFTRDRLVMLHARNLNGVHRSVEAAAFYRGLILQYPQTEIANLARPRYVLSLHYAQLYVDVAREASSLSGLMRPKDILWRTFWARYLSKQFSLALATTEHESGQEHRARFQYWRGRAYESEGLLREAKDVYNKLSLVDGANQYALYTNWRMTKAPVQPVSVQVGSVAFAAKKLSSFEFSDVSVLLGKDRTSEHYPVNEALLSAGFADLLRGSMRKRLQSLGQSGDEIAELLVRAGDANAGIQFATNQRRGLPSLPLGRIGDWKSYIAKNQATLKMLYPLAYKDKIAEAAESFQVSPWLILAIMRAESLFQPHVVSSVGARGLMQIMPTTGERIAELIGFPDFEPALLDFPAVNITLGSWYLSRLLAYYSGNLPLAIAAYNAGPESVDRWLKRNQGLSLDEFLEDIPFDQTRKYVSTVLTNMEAYSRLYSNGVKGISVNMFSPLPIPRNDLEIF
ncbi:hypothetical protein EBU99_10140 [bacterium]|nr:hypothetical protein [bacterium]